MWRNWRQLHVQTTSACASLLQVFPSEVEIYAVSSQRPKHTRALCVECILKLHEYYIRLPKEHFKGLFYFQSCIFRSLSFFVSATVIYPKKVKLNYKLIISPDYSRDETNATYVNQCIHSNEFRMSQMLICEPEMRSCLKLPLLTHQHQASEWC